MPFLFKNLTPDNIDTPHDFEILIWEFDSRPVTKECPLRRAQPTDCFPLNTILILEFDSIDDIDPFPHVFDDSDDVFFHLDSDSCDVPNEFLLKCERLSNIPPPASFCKHAQYHAAASTTEKVQS